MPNSLYPLFFFLNASLIFQIYYFRQSSLDDTIEDNIAKDDKIPALAGGSRSSASQKSIELITGGSSGGTASRNSNDSTKVRSTFSFKGFLAERRAFLCLKYTVKYDLKIVQINFSASTIEGSWFTNNDQF